MPDNESSTQSGKELERIVRELESLNPTLRQRILEKFILAALGVIPWVGGLLSAIADLQFQDESIKQNKLQNSWLEEHQNKLQILAQTLEDIGKRFEALGDSINERIQSEPYLNLVRQAFRTWDQCDTEEKRKFVANLITNAAGTRLCSDDVIRLFISWLDNYHEIHFAVMREIYQNPGVTRRDIWIALYGELVREDSAEADLFRLLIRDLNTGGVIRQARDTTEDGQFLKRRPQPRSTQPKSTMESAFEDTKPYVLTELGKQFVHYTMNEVVQRLNPSA